MFGSDDDELFGKAQDIANLVARHGSPSSSGIDSIPPETRILLHDFQLRGIPPKVGMAAVLQELRQGLKMYRQSNTLLAIKKLSPVIAQIHFFTLDNDATFQKLVAFWIDKLKQAGCHIIYDTVADPHIVKALQMVGVQLQPSDNPKYKLKGMI